MILKRGLKPLFFLEKIFSENFEKGVDILPMVCYNTITEAERHNETKHEVLKMNYYEQLKEVRKLISRKQFVQYNEYLNNSVGFKMLTTSEQICLKMALYDRFKELGYRDSKNFSYLIVTKRKEA